MPRIKWTPSAYDASRYAIDGPQFFDFDALCDLPSSKLEELEAVLRKHAGMVIADLMPARDNSLAIPRAIMWLSLRMAGVGLEWAEFDPQVLRAEFEDVSESEDDANPPALGPDGSSSGQV